MQVTTFRGKSVAVFGLGMSGNATARALIDGGASVAAWDDGEQGRAGAAAAGVPLVDLAKSDWSHFDALVLSPGVPLTHPEPHWTVNKAKEAGVPIIGDVELFFRQRAAQCPDAPVIAITGTNGKSTTTALIAHALQQLGLDVQVGGNIGRAILTLDPPDLTKVYVLELSSYQIDLTPTLAPTVGVLLNISPDHIDRHGTLENYAAVKEKVVQGASHACVGEDDVFVRAIALRRKGSLSTFGFDTTLDPKRTSYRTSGRTVTASTGETLSIANARALRGDHNAQNAAATVAAIRALSEEAPGLLRCPSTGDLEQALASFPGLPHRMEEVGIGAPVVMINDSKATNADSAEKALASFDGGIHWIVGGVAKDGGIASLAPYFSRIKKAYLIGEAAPEFANTLNGKVETQQCGTLEEATRAAFSDASAAQNSEDATPRVVLFSPACASFDQFPNFEQRGNAFKQYIAAELARWSAQ